MEKIAKISGIERILIGLLLVLAVVGVIFRLIDYNVFPGINGDELVGMVLMRQMFGKDGADLVMPSGHFASPLYTLLLLPVTFLHSASWIARLPAVVSGGAVVFAHAIWGRKVFPRRVWAMSLILLACAPLAISMSRVSWEPTLTPFLIWLTLYFLTSKQITFSLVMALLAAFNQIVAVLIFPSVFAWIWFGRASNASRRFKISLLIGLAVMVGAMTLALLHVSLEYGAMIQKALLRLIEIPTMADSFYLILQMFVGVTSLKGFAIDPSSDVSPLFTHGLPCLVLALLVAGSAVAIWKKDREALFPICFFFSLVIVYYAFAGPEMYGPGFERFPLFIFVPFCLALAFATDALFELLERPALTLGVAAVVGIFALLMFLQLYLLPFEDEGGHSSQLYASASRDPKVEAFDEIFDRLSHHEHKVIVADCWFTYFTAKYFSYRHEGVEILHLPTLEGNQNYKDAAIKTGDQLRTILENGGVAYGLAGGRFEQVFQGSLDSLKIRTYISTSGSPIIQVWEKER